jgi:hypothetical protein
MRKEFAPVLDCEIEEVAVVSNGLALDFHHAGLADKSTRTNRIRLRPYFVHLCTAALAVGLTGCSVQTIVRAVTSDTPEPQKPAKMASASHKKAPKPAPTQQELFEYVRSGLLSLSPNDGVNDNLEVAYNPDISTLTITQPDGRCDIYLNAIDNNSAVWEVIDPTESNRPRADILRLTINSISGKPARTCYDSQNQIDTSVARNRARLFFSLSKSRATYDFTNKMDKAIKELVVASGGAPEKQVL